MSENNDYPVYIPDIIPTHDEKFIKKFNSFFAYDIIHLHVDKNTVKYIKRIIEFKLCPKHSHKLYFMNCFNRLDNLKFTLIMACHVCNEMFVISGRYSTRLKFEKAIQFLNDKIKRDREYRLTHNIVR